MNIIWTEVNQTYSFSSWLSLPSVNCLRVRSNAEAMNKIEKVGNCNDNIVTQPNLQLLKATTSPNFSFQKNYQKFQSHCIWNLLRVATSLK